MKTVNHTRCDCGKRGFYDEHDAEKALGRAQAKRNRMFGDGCRRGMVRETRFYECPSTGLYHLTSENKRSFQTRHPVRQEAWA